MRLFYQAVSVLSVSLALGAGSGCAGDLSEELNKDPMDAGSMQTDMPQQSGRVTNTQESGGSTLSVVNAADYMTWVYIQLATGKEVTPQDPLNSTEWDLAVQRFQIKVNGGISGKGGVEVAVAAGAAFDTLEKAPASGYVTDRADSADEGTDPDYAFTEGGEWYAYNPMTHVLTPKDQVYAVRSAAGTYFKLQMKGYYDKAGSAGYPSFRWKAITAP